MVEDFLGGNRTVGNEDVSELLLVNEPSCSKVTICLSSLLKCVSDPSRGRVAKFTEAHKNHWLHCTCESSSTKCSNSTTVFFKLTSHLSIHQYYALQNTMKPVSYNCLILFSVQVLLVCEELLV